MSNRPLRFLSAGLVAVALAIGAAPAASAQPAATMKVASAAKTSVKL